MNINFSKAEAAGNDFIILDNRSNKLFGAGLNFSDFAKYSCKRKYSVGADGVLILEKSDKADMKMRILNPDGSEVAMCGNGIRCSAYYAYQKGWCVSSMRIETLSGILEANVSGNSVKIKMPLPKDIKLNQNLGVGKTIMNIHSINTGVPHVVHFVEDLKNYPVKESGKNLRHHKMFEPGGTNADFVKVRDKSTIEVRTYERGVEDETLACGTGVVASSLITHLINGIESPIKALTKGGEVLKVYFKKEQKEIRDVYLEGDSRIAFEGGLDYV